MVSLKLKNEVAGTFLKAQCSSIISTIADFLFTLFFTRVAGLWYLLSSSMGTMLGGCVNFSLGRNWVFNIKHHKKLAEAKRYMVVWTGSLLLNACGVYLLTEVLRLHYIVSKSIITVIVGVFFNFYLQKTFVFRTYE